MKPTTYCSLSLSLTRIMHVRKLWPVRWNIHTCTVCVPCLFWIDLFYGNVYYTVCCILHLFWTMQICSISYGTLFINNRRYCICLFLVFFFFQSLAAEWTETCSICRWTNFSSTFYFIFVYFCFVNVCVSFILYRVSAESHLTTMKNVCMRTFIS